MPYCTEVSGAKRWVIAAAQLLVAGRAAAQLDGSVVSLEHPAIDYRSGVLSNPVALLQQRLEQGAALELDPRAGIGYLPALLRELGVPAESQLLVYSKTSLQQRLITPERPRALYFNDGVVLGTVHDGVIEIAVQDAKLGAVFTTRSRRWACRDSSRAVCRRLSTGGRCRGSATRP
jgi:hypothetical protein